MTEHEALLKEWQDRLGLQSWRIKLNPCVIPCDMAMQNVDGCTEWQETIRTARIDILDPVCYGERIIPFDWEKTLVHELLHLKFSLAQDVENDMQSRLMHMYIDDIARALVDAKRSGKDGMETDSH